MQRMTKWAGEMFPRKDLKTGNRFKHKNDPMAGWYNEMLGKNYYYKHNGLEPAGKTAELRQ